MVPSAPRKRGFLAATSGVLAVVLNAALVTFAAGCSGGGGGGQDGGCTHMFNPSCTATTPPSFATDVAPVIHEHCTPCHGPGQQIPTLDTYANVTNSRTESRIIFVYQMCRMPPPPLPELATDQWAIINSWLACGAAP